MSALVRPDKGKFHIVPPKDSELNEYLLKLNANRHYPVYKLGVSDDYPFFDVKIDGISENAAGYLIDNDLLCDAPIPFTGGQEMLFFVLTSQGSGSSRHWKLEDGRLYMPEFDDQICVTFDDHRALLRRILSQR